MEIIVIFIAIDVIASKFLDSFIQYYRYNHYNAEHRDLDFQKARDQVWLSFFLCVLMVCSSIAALELLPLDFHWLFVVLGTFSTIVNLASAHSGYFGRKNLITASLRR